MEKQKEQLLYLTDQTEILLREKEQFLEMIKNLRQEQEDINSILSAKEVDKLSFMARIIELEDQVEISY